MGRDRFDRKVDRTVDTKPDTIERFEVITGSGRRRSWPFDAKARIVMESLEEGAVISEVARRHGVRPQQLFAWRKQVGDHVPAIGFAPVVVDAATAALPSPAPQSNGAPATTLSEIEITLGSAVVRVRGAVDARTLAAVLKVLKVLA